MRSDCTHSRSGILSPHTTHGSGSAIIFVKLGLSFSEFSTSSLSSLDSSSDYLGINISFNNSSSLSVLDLYDAPIRPSLTDDRTHFFSPSILSSSKNLLILGDFNCHHSLWDSKGTPEAGGKYLIKPSLLTSSSSMALTYLFFFIAPLAVTPPRTFSLLLPLLLLEDASGPGF